MQVLLQIIHFYHQNLQKEDNIMKKKTISLQQLVKDFPIGELTVHALRKIDLDIYDGDFVSILGASGSGKSTLLNILGCLDVPTSGNYFLDGIDVKMLSKNQLADIRNMKLGFVFQSYNLLARTTALENVELPLLYNKSIKSKERKRKAKKALETVGLADRMYHTPNQLSGGQQQRVAIARSLVNDPLLILADEPTGNLDTRTSYEIMNTLSNLNNDGKTIILVTHEEDIAKITSRNILFRDGRILKDIAVENRSNPLQLLAQLPEDYENYAL